MMITTEHAIAHINQIAHEFEELGAEEGARATADHVQLFWAPLLRESLAQTLHDAPERLSPIARAAARMVVGSAKASGSTAAALAPV